MTDQSIEQHLSAQAFFAGLNPEFIRFLARCASVRRLDPGQVVFRLGERARHFYLVRNGSISIEIQAIMGPTLKVQSLGAGQILGWSWLIAPYKWNFQATVEEPTELLEFDGDAVLVRCEAEPKFGYELLKRFAALMSERLDAARQKMMEQWNPPGFA